MKKKLFAYDGVHAFKRVFIINVCSFFKALFKIRAAERLLRKKNVLKFRELYFIF